MFAWTKKKKKGVCVKEKTNINISLTRIHLLNVKSQNLLSSINEC